MIDTKFPKGVLRFPRYGNKLEVKLEALILEGSACFLRGRDANVDFGRVLRRIKKIVGHGNWECFLAVKFPAVPARTAQRYMRWAKEEDAKPKAAILADFKEGTNPAIDKARSITARRKAQAKPKLFHIALSIPPERQDAIRELQRSPAWLKAEPELIFILEKYTQKAEVPSADIVAA